MESVVDALITVLETKRALEECRASRDYDADYFCTPSHLSYKRALSEFETALTHMMDQRIDQDGQAADGHYHCWHNPHAGDLVWRSAETRVCCHCGDTQTWPTFETRPHGPHAPKAAWE